MSPRKPFLTSISSNNYAAARLQGLERDLNLHGDQYQVGLSKFFSQHTYRKASLSGR